jgi:GH43 family beta-xylosidase
MDGRSLVGRRLNRRDFLVLGAGAGAGLATMGLEAPFAQGRERARRTYINPLYGGADPYVVRDRGYYYRTFSDGVNNLYVSKSRSMIDRGKIVRVHTFPAGQWNSTMLWGPFALVRWDDGRYYIFYCAARDLGDFQKSNETHRLGVLRANSNNILGSYTDLGEINCGDRWAIGPTAFQGFGGEWYLTWSGWEENGPFPQVTYVAPMQNPWTVGDRVLISRPDKAWEGVPNNPLQEGQMVHRRGDRLILLYSANGSWTDDYCLGMLTYARRRGDGPEDILDPERWTKSDEPVFEKTDYIKGPGGPSIVQSADGREDWLFYHSAVYPGSGWTRYINAKKISWNADGTPRLGEPVPYYEPRRLPSGDPGRPPIDVYEAEDATLRNAPVVDRFLASGGKAALVSAGESYVEFEVEVSKAGYHTLGVRYATDVGGSAGAVSLDGRFIKEIRYETLGSDNFWLDLTGVRLRPGTRRVRVEGRSGSAAIDLLEITRAVR